jgi:hypothetical protein
MMTRAWPRAITGQAARYDSLRMDTVVLGVRVGLAAVFAVAAMAKLVDQPGARDALVGFHVPARFVRPFAVVLPLAELATATALLVQVTARWGAAAAVVLLGAFVVGITRALVRGETPDCHCFGQISSSPAGKSTLVRNGVLAAAAVVVVVNGSGTSISGWIDGHSAAELVAVLTSAGCVLFAALTLRLWLERRDLLSETTTARTVLEALPAGLPIGAQAPRFVLPDPVGNPVSLDDLLERGKPVALLFVSPGCVPCQAMMSDIARWQTTLADRLTIALVFSGERTAIRDLTDRHQLQDVLLQKDHEVYNTYLMPGTPSGLILTPDGHVGSSTNSSNVILEVLIRTALSIDFGGPAETAERVAAGGMSVQQWTTES